MRHVAVLTSRDLVPGQTDGREDLFELERQLAALTPACRAVGVELQLCVWDAPETERRVCVGDFEAVVVGTVWDYQNRAGEFLDTMDRFHAKVPVLNAPHVLRWNAHKSYLRALGEAGVPTIPTQWVDRVTPSAIARAFAAWDVPCVVAKPVVGACAERQIRVHRGETLPEADRCPPGAALVQPYVESIEREGEVSFLFFGGVFSHAVVKRPAQGDYRIQSVYGGTEAVHRPDPGEIRLAGSVLEHVPGVCRSDLLYARVDLIRGDDGGLLLMELELIEPYLYPQQGPMLGECFARALVGRGGFTGA